MHHLHSVGSEKPSPSFHIYTVPSTSYCPTGRRRWHQSSLKSSGTQKGLLIIIQTIKKCHHPRYIPTPPGAVVARTIVELAVGFLTVDDVEAVRDGSLHAAHLEVEPLLVLGAVYVSVDQQVILKPVESEARANSGAALQKLKRCYFCLLHAHSPILDPRSMTFVLGFLSL